MLLDITISSTWLVGGTIAVLVACLVIYSTFSELKDKAHQLERDSDRLRADINVLALATFEKFKATELETHKRVVEKSAIETAEALLEKWKLETNDSIRKDAIKRSMAVNLGKITEHLIPFSPQFKDFNPQDARFIGSPIDLIVFDGAAGKANEVNIVFIEVKTGNSVLNETQKKIKRAVEEHRISWLELRKGELSWGS